MGLRVKPYQQYNEVAILEEWKNDATICLGLEASRRVRLETFSTDCPLTGT